MCWNTETWRLWGEKARKEATQAADSNSSILGWRGRQAAFLQECLGYNHGLGRHLDLIGHRTGEDHQDISQISLYAWHPQRLPLQSGVCTGECSTTLLRGPEFSVLSMHAVQASERVPVSVCGIHCTVTILAWVGVATAKGDYRYRPPNFVFGAQQKAMLLACLSGALTWVGLHLRLAHLEPSWSQPCISFAHING